MSKQIRHLYDFGHFRLDPAEHLLLRDGQPVPLRPKLFDILLILVENSGHLVENKEMMKMVWPDSFVEEGNLNKYISMLRQVLGESPTAHQYIETIPKHGYRFIASITEVRGENVDLVVAKKHTRAHIIIEEEEETNGHDQIEQVTEPKAFVVSSRKQRGAMWRLSPTVLILFVMGVGLASALYYFSISSKTEKMQINPAVGSIAVLPFKSMGEDTDEYLRVGMADALITRLSNAKQIIVRPTSAVLKYANQAQDPLEAGRQLGADAVLEGSIQKSGERVRLTVQLVNVRDGSPLWAETFDEKFTNIFAVQDSISERVAQALTLELTGEEKKGLLKRYTENTEAYQAYLKGRYFWNKRTDEGFKKAISYFEQAIEIDPSYALAYAGLGDCYHLLALYGLLPSNEYFPKAKAAVTKALEIDGTLAEARASLAFIRLNYDWDWSGAEGEFKRALALNPNYATAHQWYGWQLMLMGRQEESFAEMNRAQQLDPFSLAIQADLGLYFYYTREYDRAIEQFRKTLEMDPNLRQVHTYLASVYLRKGMYEEALAEAEKALTPSTTTASGMIGVQRNELVKLREAYAVSGIKGYWQKGIEVERERAKRERTPIIAGNMASYYANLGEKDQALQWLEKAYQDRSNQMLYLNVDQWDGCRSDPRFTDLMRRVGLTP